MITSTVEDCGGLAGARVVRSGAGLFTAAVDDGAVVVRMVIDDVVGSASSPPPLGIIRVVVEGSNGVDDDNNNAACEVSNDKFMSIDVVGAAAEVGLAAIKPAGAPK
jgi:hypothetical protein